MHYLERSFAMLAETKKSGVGACVSCTKDALHTSQLPALVSDFDPKTRIGQLPHLVLDDVLTVFTKKGR